MPETQYSGISPHQRKAHGKYAVNDKLGQHGDEIIIADQWEQK